MKKEYAVNVRYSHSDEEWRESDKANWYDTYAAAIAAAEKEFEYEDIEEVMVSVYEDGEIEDSPLYMRMENGIVIQEQNGQRLWL